MADPVTRHVGAGQRCAQCNGPLPGPIERLAVVHGRAGETMTTCSTICLAELVTDLAGRTALDRRSVAGRRN